MTEVIWVLTLLYSVGDATSRIENTYLGVSDCAQAGVYYVQQGALAFACSPLQPVGSAQSD